MIADKRMQFIKSEEGINYYLFRPSVFSLYYDDRKCRHESEPPHRHGIAHKLHMLLYILLNFGEGGYRVLYLERDGEVLSYIIFVKANKLIIKDCEKDDYYTIFLWTYPEHRGKGLATLMAKTMLSDLPLKFNHFYKTISKDNASSMRVAEKCGFQIKCDSLKTKLLHTIHQVNEGDQYLYCYKRGETAEVQ